MDKEEDPTSQSLRSAEGSESGRRTDETSKSSPVGSGTNKFDGGTLSNDNTNSYGRGSADFASSACRTGSVD